MRDPRVVVYPDGLPREEVPCKNHRLWDAGCAWCNPGPDTIRVRGIDRSAQVEDEVVAAVRDSVVRFDDQAIRDIVRIVRATIRRVGGE